MDRPRRASTRYEFALPALFELRKGFLRRPESVEAIIVNLSGTGASLVLSADDRLRPSKRYRVLLDGYSGLVEIRRLIPLPNSLVRIGVEVKHFEVELQELVADLLEEASRQRSSLT